MLKTVISTVAIALALTACATSPLPIEQLHPVPSIRLSWVDSRNPQAGTLIVARDSGLKWSAAHVMVSIDGKLAGEIRPAEVMRLKVEPGHRVVYVSATTAVGGSLLGNMSSVVEVTPLTDSIYRIGVGKKVLPP